MAEKQKILIVDDDPDFSAAMQTLLEARGYRVSTAQNGEEGFTKARAEKPDLMILDVMMTYDNEGFELAKKIKEDETTKKTPVILITGIRKAKNLPFSFEPDPDWLPVAAVLEKPVKADELLDQVSKALGS